MSLKMNLNKTQIMSNSPKIIEIDGHAINQYVYLGHVIRIGKQNQLAER